MNVSQVRTYLNEKASPPPTDPVAYQKWLEFTDTIEFLLYSASGQVPVYISSPYFYVYSVIVPKRKLKGDYVDNLMQWNFSVSSGWGYGYRYAGKTRRIQKEISPPIDSTSSSILDGEEGIFFLRSLYQDSNVYLELNQRLAHILGVHQVRQRNAYCKVDDETGELLDIITYEQDDEILCTIDKAFLDFYLFLTDSVLVRVFDVTRWNDSFIGWDREMQRATFKDDTNEIYAHRGQNTSQEGITEAGYIRGVQIIRQSQPNRQMLAELKGGKKKKKQYTTFIAIDWRHEKTQECSCDPEKLGNYFVESDLPFGTSPAFFRPEVMSRYKQHPDKYTIDTDIITCRGAWSLRYHTNDAGQIHAYLIDLAHLPTSEQHYWKAFNEKPKAGMSEHVIQRDFYASWDWPHDPLEALKGILRDFPVATYRGERAAIFRHPQEKQLAKLTYVMTDSPKEWEDQILELAKVLGDGLSKKELRKVAKYLNCDDSQLGSINLLKKCLEAKQLDTESTVTIVQPLQTLFGLRSTIAAHAGRSAPDENLQEHHKKLVGDCERSMELLSKLIREEYLDVT